MIDIKPFIKLSELDPKVKVDWEFLKQRAGSFSIVDTGRTHGGLDGNTPIGGNDIFLTKYNSSGTKQWTKLHGSSLSYSDWGDAIATDTSGNIFITGDTIGDLGGNTNQGTRDMFLVKYNSSGTRLWTNLLGTTDEDWGYGVDTDSSGNIYVTGHSFGDFDGISNLGSSAAFLVKYDSSGTKQWTKLLDSSSSEAAKGVIVDSSDNIYITGAAFDDLDGITNQGGNDIFLVKYDSSGTKLWTRLLGSSVKDYGWNITVDSSDNLYITGYTDGNIDGNTNQGDEDIFLAKYDSSGNYQWTKQLGTSGDERGQGVATDSSGNIYVSGYTWGNLDGNINQGIIDVFLVKYNSSGINQWTEQFGTSSDDRGTEVATDSSGNIYVTGYTSGNLDGNSNQGIQDIFIVKYNSSGERQ